MLSLEIQLMLTLTICIVSSYTLTEIGKKFKLPNVVSPLVMGLIISSQIYYIELIIPSFKEIVSIFANLGLILVLFFLGLKVDVHFIKKLSKNSSIMALNAGIVPFALGFYVTYLFGHSALVSLFVGVCLSITAEEVSISILEELNLIKKKVGQLIMEAGLIGDVFEILIIAFLGVVMKSLMQSSTTYLFQVIAEFSVFILTIVTLRYVLVPFLQNRLGLNVKNSEVFLSSFVVLLVMVSVAELVNFGHIVGALVAELILKDVLIEDKQFKREHKVSQVLETVTFGFFEPLIYIWVGLTVSIKAMTANLPLGITLVFIAIIGKLLGAVIGNLFCKGTIKEGLFVGWALNARGATELIAIIVAKNQGIITENVYAAIVFMALVTTLISPIVFKYMATHNAIDL